MTAGRPRQPKHGYGRPPAKGTKERQLLLMLLRPQGVTSYELVRAGVITDKYGYLTATFARLEDMKGYDIRCFKLEPRTVERVGELGMRSKKPPLVYRLVGRRRWNLTYRSFLGLTGSLPDPRVAP